MFRPVLLITCLFASCNQSGSGAHEGDKELQGAEIQQLFAGKTVEGHHELWNYDFISFYEPSGAFRSYQGASKTMREARWWVDGNRICIHWKDEDPAGDLCRTMLVDKDGHYRKVLKLDGDRQKLIVTFKAFRDGNPGRL